MKPPIRVLVADDSEAARGALTQLLSVEPGLQVVGAARDGLEAVELARRLKPDVITMDVQMPKLSGLEAIAAIMADTPARILVVASVTRGSEVDLSFRAIAAGALELIAKPDGGGPDAVRQWGRHIARSVRLMAEIPVVRRWRGHTPGLHHLRGGQGRVDVVALVASTGGPPALARVLSSLPGDLPASVCIAQHIAPGFLDGLLRWFRHSTALKVELARDGAECVPGTVYIPPDGCDLELTARGAFSISRTTGLYSPSGDRLLASLAASYGPRAMGVVMTGMGDDGAQGLLALRKAGGYTLAQDEATSVVFGMPAAARALGATGELVPLEQLAALVTEAARAPVQVRQRA